MLTLLVPVDGSPGSNRAVNWVIKLYRDVTPVRIHLLHVLTPSDPNAVGLVSRHASSYEDQASDESALSSARALLDRAEVPYMSEVRTGFVPSTIVECGRTLQCDGIVIGTRGMGTTDAILGSIARQVIHLADVPVTLVK